MDAQLADRFDEHQSRPDGRLGIVLVRVRVTKVDEHPIAHVLGHEAVEPSDRPRDALMIGADHGTRFVESAVEPTRSVNMTVSWRRSASSRAFGSGGAAG